MYLTTPNEAGLDVGNCLCREGFLHALPQSVDQLCRKIFLVLEFRDDFPSKFHRRHVLGSIDRETKQRADHSKQVCSFRHISLFHAVDVHDSQSRLLQDDFCSLGRVDLEVLGKGCGEVPLGGGEVVQRAVDGDGGPEGGGGDGAQGICIGAAVELRYPR